MLFLIRNLSTNTFQGVITSTEARLFWSVDEYANPFDFAYKPLKPKGVNEFTTDGDWFIFEIPNGYESLHLVLKTI